jgi:hypothetical protein
LELLVAVFEWVHIITNSLLDFEIFGLNVLFKIQMYTSTGPLAAGDGNCPFNALSVALFWSWACFVWNQNQDMHWNGTEWKLNRSRDDSACNMYNPARRITPIDGTVKLRLFKRTTD